MKNEIVRKILQDAQSYKRSTEMHHVSGRHSSETSNTREFAAHGNIGTSLASSFQLEDHSCPIVSNILN